MKVRQNLYIDSDLSDALDALVAEDQANRLAQLDAVS